MKRKKDPFQTDDQDQAVEEAVGSGLEELFSLNVATLDGQSAKLAETFKKPFVVLGLLRHFG